MAGSGSSNLVVNAEENCCNELTMIDVLEEEKELEEDAKAVLGDSDDKNCTFNEGYVARQALYACATCYTDSEPGGICLACSYACHEGHDLFELYTKRNFRCDCGNNRFPNNRCHLCPNKDQENVDNKYNQNFRGKYCNCHRPYPDDQEEAADEMFQCIICEDWYHGRHIGGEVPEENFSEMICPSCMDSHSFLYRYCVLKKDTNMAYCSFDDGKYLENKSGPSFTGDDTIVKVEYCENKLEVTGITENVNSGHCVAKCNVDSTPDCKLKKFGDGNIEMLCKAVFWPKDWRKMLCVCHDCISLYKEKKCMFLLDENDTIHAYEERGKYRSGEESQYDKGLSALGRLDRVKQIEVIHEYNTMKGELNNYLKHFAENKQTVCKKDILDFFETMHQRKRQRIDNYVPPFCR